MSAANRKWKDVLRERAYEIYPYKTLEQLCEASHDPEANLALYRIMVNGGEMFTPTMLAAYFPIQADPIATRLPDPWPWNQIQLK
jgi:hypothetical protein